MYKTKSDLRRLNWYQVFRNIAAAHGGEVVSISYIRMHDKMEFKCAMGHLFTARCHDVHQNGSWCPECAKNKKLTISYLQHFARKRNGSFLSHEYLGLTREHLWKCSAGHTFEEKPQNLLYSEKFCPYCSRIEKRSKFRAKKLNEIREIVESHGGILLSAEYVSSRTKLTIEIKNKTFQISPEKIIHTTWWNDFE